MLRNASGHFHAINVWVDAEHSQGAATGANAFGDVNRTWHSQSGQDFIVASVFGMQRDLSFVDLAANQPIRYSNSRSLERDLGWQGLCVEPNPELLW